MFRGGKKKGRLRRRRACRHCVPLRRARAALSSEIWCPSSLPLHHSGGRTATNLSILGALLIALLDGLQRGQPVASLAKKMCSGLRWLDIFIVDVLPTPGSVSSIVAVLLHGCWSACSTLAHSGDTRGVGWRVQICWKERALCSTAHCHGGRHLC